MTSFHFDISLAQWSLHQAFFNKQIDVLDFPSIARDQYQISAVEYVNQFFPDKAKDSIFLHKLLQRSIDANVENLLIMIDHEGELAATDKAERNKAVDGHKKWVEAAASLNCQAVRVNLHGSMNEVDWAQASFESLQLLGEFAATCGLKVLVENHGGLSAKINALMPIINRLNSTHIGTMPDFGNFCIRREVPGDLWESPCIEHYDAYDGVSEMLPWAGAVSAKTFDFDINGYESNIDYERMLRLIKASAYRGWIGIEYEGKRLSEDDGIKATKALLEKLRSELA